MPATPDATDALLGLDDHRIEAFGMLVEAHNELLGSVTRRLQDDMGLPVPWLGVLIRLARSPGGRLRMTVLARDMTISTSGLTRLIDRVEAAGHVRREACPGDRRGLLAVLTDEGRRIVEDAAPRHIADLEEHLASALDPGELEQFTDLLRKVRNHVRALRDACD